MVYQDQDHYSVLGLKAKASAHEVKRAYRNLCKQYHPDKAAHLDETTKRERAAQMVRLNAAYQVLNSPKQRFEYDLISQPYHDARSDEQGGMPFNGVFADASSRTRTASGRFRYPYSAKYTQRSRQARRMDPSQYTTHIDGRAAEFTHRPEEDVNKGRYSPSDPELSRPMPWEQREMDLVKEWMQAYCPPEPPDECSAKCTQRSRQARRMDPSQYTTHIDGRAAEFTHRPEEDVNKGRYSPSDPELSRPMPWEQREMDLVKEWMQAYCPPEPPEEQYQWTRASDHFLRNLREKRQQRGKVGPGKAAIPVATVEL